MNHSNNGHPVSFLKIRIAFTVIIHRFFAIQRYFSRYHSGMFPALDGAEGDNLQRLVINPGQRIADSVVTYCVGDSSATAVA